MKMCTYVIFPRTEMGPVIGQTLDDALHYSEAPGFGSPPSAPTYPANGIIGSGVSGWYDSEPEPEEVFPFQPSVESCQSVDEIAELLLRYKHFNKQPSNQGFLDLNTGQTLMVELSYGDGDAWLAQDPDGIIYDTAFGCRSSKLRPYCDQAGGAFHWYETRMAAIGQLIDNNRRRLGVEAMWQVLLSHASGGAVCQHVDTRPPGVFIVTLSMSVTAPALGRIWQRKLKDGLPPCAAEPAEARFDPWPIGY